MNDAAIEIANYFKKLTAMIQDEMKDELIDVIDVIIKEIKEKNPLAPAILPASGAVLLADKVETDNLTMYCFNVFIHSVAKAKADSYADHPLLKQIELFGEIYPTASEEVIAKHVDSIVMTAQENLKSLPVGPLIKGSSPTLRSYAIRYIAFVLQNITVTKPEAETPTQTEL